VLRCMWSFRSNYEHEIHDTLPCGDVLKLFVASIAMGDGSLDSACWRTSSFLVTGLWCRVQDDDEGETIEINAASGAA
jgi:hypothetical protein